MELNAKLSSLEDEVKLLKGEVKVILSEIRAAILGQDNPFTGEPGQGMHADPEALERPPIRVVKIPSEGEEEESAVNPSPPPAEATLDVPASVAQPEEAPQPAAPPPEPPAREPEKPPKPPEARAAPPPAPSPPPAPAAPVPPAPQPAHEWSLLTVAGLTVWAEDAAKQVGPERLRILLDLCEFTGYLSAPAKEALLRVSSLTPAVEEKHKPPSVNDCLVVLYQLDALMRGEESAGGRRFLSLQR
jgi:hypothetical protein